MATAINLRISILLCAFLLLSVASKGQAPSAYAPEPSFEKYELQSFYLKMRDGVELAVDLVLPEGLAQGQKIPAILHQTRYWRGLDLRWPFSKAIEPGPPSLWALMSTEALVRQGYALVSVDVRGTGASKGTRPYEMPKSEVLDGMEVLDWITEQPWSNGTVGAIGISYNGWNAQMMAISGHPALKCILPINAPFDGFDEMTHPGGIQNEYLLSRWSSICKGMDVNELSSRFRGKKFLVKGFPVVEEGRENPQREEICELHASNQYAEDVLRRIQYRDDSDPSLGDLRIDSTFPCGHMEGVRASQAAVYSFSGWYDMSGVKAATRQFLNYGADQGGGRNKVLFGPWNHGGRKAVSPFAEPGPIAFDRLGEALKFFDYHLKGLENGLYDEPLVHYFHMGEEAWRSSGTWPPQGLALRPLYLKSDGRMGRGCAKQAGKVDFVLDTVIAAGNETRWELSGSSESQYGELLAQWMQMLSFTTEPMDAALDMTGESYLDLHLQTAASDGYFFAYLVDVAADGRQRLMTQGQIRAIHRNSYVSEGTYAGSVPYCTYLKRDAEPFGMGTERLLIYFQPTSWRLQEGHRLRLLLAGADRSHFGAGEEQPFPVTLLLEGPEASKLQLSAWPTP